jgi:hypothetical protein
MDESRDVISLLIVSMESNSQQCRDQARGIRSRRRDISPNLPHAGVPGMSLHNQMRMLVRFSGDTSNNEWKMIFGCNPQLQLDERRGSRGLCPRGTK